MSADLTPTNLANPISLYAALYRSPQSEAAVTLMSLAADFSPRFERHRDDLVAIDVSGLAQLLGPARTIGEELRRTAAARGVCVHAAVAGTQTAALILAQARPGITIVEPGEEAAALAPVPIGFLERIDPTGADLRIRPGADVMRPGPPYRAAPTPIAALKRWGVKTLGELAAMPSADLSARLGQAALVWQAIARGVDTRPLVPALDEERFESSLDLEWPVEGLEPLSFVLTRLLEPLSTRLERRDRGAAVLHVVLGLVTKDVVRRSLQLPAPIRDVRTLRTLALLDLDARPPGAAIDRVQIVIDPTPGRVLQHTLFTRAHPTIEQMSTLLARLGALMGQDRIGAAVLVDSYRPGAFTMQPFKTEHDDHRRNRRDSAQPSVGAASAALKTDHVDSARSACSVSNVVTATTIVSALRRCRQPVPARVVVAGDRPVRVTTDRGGFPGGAVLTCTGPWRTSGEWWALEKPDVQRAGRAGTAWNRDEWDVALADGAVYRIFRDRDRDAWFVDAIVD